MPEPIVFEALVPGGSVETYAEAEGALRLSSLSFQGFAGSTTDSGWATGAIRLRSSATAYLGFSAPGESVRGGLVVMPPLRSTAIGQFDLGLTTYAGWGIRPIRLSSHAEGELEYPPTGGFVTDGRGAMPRLRSFAIEAEYDAGTDVDGYAIGLLPRLTTFVLDDQLTLLPQDGQGEAAMPALSTSATGYRGINSSDCEVALRLRSFAMEATIASGDDYYGWAIGSLPPLFAAAVEESPVLDAYVLMLGPPAYLSGFADLPQTYLVDFLHINAEVEDTTVRVLREALALGPMVLTLPIYRPVLTEILSLRDTVRLINQETIDEIVAWVLTQTVTQSRVTELVERLLLTGAATTNVNALAIIAEALAVHDTLMRVLDGELTEIAAFNDTVNVRYSAFEQIVLGLAFADTVQGLAILRVDLAESLLLSDEIEPLVTWQALLSESIAWSVSLTREGVPYYAMALNTTNKAVSEYTNYDFNSLATFNGVTYGAGAAGLYRLEGDDDAGTDIDAFIRTAMHRVAGGREMTASDAYLGLRTNGDMQLKVVVNNRAGQRVGYVFDMIRSPSGAAQQGRFKLGKGLKSVYMAFELSNNAGSDFAADVLEVRPLVSYRRVP